MGANPHFGAEGTPQLRLEVFCESNRLLASRSSHQSTVLGETMYYGTGIVLIVVGAILRWAVADRVQGINLPMIGLICMVGGVLAIVLTMLSSARGTRTTRHTEVDPATGARTDRIDTV
ncbi:MAG TPA: DUF6458 family protein [Marmoricola sp.]|nr:DUF6458 family protein [Marmoricola sp.]